jgi:hypothetical protein
MSVAESKIESARALRPFFALPARNIENPETLVALSPCLIERLQALTAGVNVDPDDLIERFVGL